MAEQAVIILFDSECLICNHFVHFIIKNDKNKNIYFTGFNSDIGKNILEKLPSEVQKIDSLIFSNEQNFFIYSDAILNIFKNMGGVWTIIAYFLLCIPRKFRDTFYRLFAKRRYSWLRNTTCPLPPPEMRKHILA